MTSPTRIKITQKELETAHQWIDDDGNQHSTVLRLFEGDELTAEALAVGDPARLMAKLVKLGYAVEV
jgi:hypothetical protein